MLLLRLQIGAVGWRLQLMLVFAAGVVTVSAPVEMVSVRKVCACIAGDVLNVTL